MSLYGLLLLNLGIVALFGSITYYLHGYVDSWYLRANRTKNIFNSFYEKFILLEVKLPREVNKSPQAMEFVIDAFYQMAGNPRPPKPDDLKKLGYFARKDKEKMYRDDAYDQGQMRLWMTMEIESRGGELHFYIGTQKRYKDIISSYIFSQYPGIEVSEAEDYTTKIRPVVHGGEYEPWTSEAELNGKDYLPIKTYVDYGMDKDPKDEFKIDPMIPLLESMANIKEDEHVWYQVLIRASQDKIGKDGKPKNWKKEGRDRIDKILGIKRVEGNEEEIAEQSKDVTKLPPKEKNELELIDRNISKLGFDTIIRMIYLAPKDSLRQEGDQIIRNALKSFNNEQFNTLRMRNQNTTNAFLDFPDKRIEKNKKAGRFALYCMRNPMLVATSQDTSPFKGLKKKWTKFGYRQARDYLKEDLVDYFTKLDDKELDMGFSFVMNSEELATIYHFPSRAFTAPKFARVESVKSEPPANLPI
jgi:hypothetical protein